MMIEIDGSLGEGGGQILRSALTLSAITGKAFHIINIRANRKNPGLRPQHHKSVLAAKKICNAVVDGCFVSSPEIFFLPQRYCAKNLKIDIGTAGSTSLLLQTVFVPLSLAETSSKIVITGGTHTRWAPSFDYLSDYWLPNMRELGFFADIRLIAAGYYPKGGGKITGTIKPAKVIHPLNLIDRGRLVRINGKSTFSNLNREIANRQKTQAYRRLANYVSKVSIRVEHIPSKHKGTMFFISAVYENCISCHYALGELHKSAEKVANEAVDEFDAFFASNGSIDRYLADQLIIPLSIANGPSAFTTSHVTRHLRTNAEITKKFVNCDIVIHGDLNQPGRIEITPGTCQ